MGNGHIKNEESARVSIPGQIKKYVINSSIKMYCKSSKNFKK